MPDFSIIIPAYNEEDRIKKTLDAYLNFYKNAEIIVVNDGSTDRTEEIVKELSEKHKIILINQKNQGKGAAILNGFRFAKGDLLSYVDADNATKPEQLHFLLKNIENYGCIIGSRWMEGSKITTKQSLSRRISSRGFNLLVRLMLNLQFSDTQAGAKVFRKEAIEKIFPKIKTTGWAFDVSLLYNIKKEGYTIKEVPIEWEEPGGSRLKLKKAIPAMFFALLKLRFQR